MTGLRTTTWLWLRRGGALVVTVVLVEYFVLPKIVDARADVSLLSSAVPLLLILALTFEVASLLCYSALTRATLRSSPQPGYWRLLRIDLTGLGVSHVVPGEAPRQPACATGCSAGRGSVTTTRSPVPPSRRLAPWRSSWPCSCSACWSPSPGSRTARRTS